MSSSSWAARISGKVTDSLDAPIPFVKVTVENSARGAISDFNGEFILDLPLGKHTLIFENIEFVKKTLDIDLKQNTQKINVTLQYLVKNLDILNIKSDSKDPAYAIIRQAIDNRKKYQKQFDRLSYKTYAKSTVEKQPKPNDTDSTELSKKHNNLIESFSTTHFSAPNSYKQVVHAFNNYQNLNEVRQVELSVGGSDDGPPTGQQYNPYLFRQSTIEPGFNFYDNRIHHPGLSSNPLISPISSAALVTYNYKMMDSWMENGKLIYKIKVIPKRQISSTFTGHVFIEDGSFALTGVDLEINSKILLKYKSFHILHSYQMLDSMMVLDREEYFFTDTEFGSLIFGNTTMLHSDYDFSPDFPKNYFRNEVKLVEDSAYSYDSTFWNPRRPVPLKQKEYDFMKYQDSVYAHRNSAEYLDEQDSIYNRFKILDVLFMGVGLRNWTKKRELYFSPLIEQVKPLGVGGYRHTLPFHLKKEWKTGYAIDVEATPDFGFKNKDLKAILDTRFTYLPKKFGKIHLLVGDYYSELNEMASISSFFSRSNYVNKKALTIGHSMEIFNGGYLSADFEYSKTYPITGLELSDWSNNLFGSLNVPTDFDPFSEFYIDAKFTYTPMQKYFMEPHKKVILGSNYPVFALHYKKGIEGLFGSVVDFDFLELSIKHSFKTASLGESKWEVHAGDFFKNNNVMLTDFKYFRGSDRFIFTNPLQYFQLLGPSIPTTNAFFQANYIHHFNGSLLNKVPLLNRLKLQAVGGAGILMVDDQSFKHIEMYAGIEKPFRLFKELVKVGVYYVGSDSNYSDIQGQIKIGFDFFNAFTQKWSY